MLLWIYAIRQCQNLWSCSVTSSLEWLMVQLKLQKLELQPCNKNKVRKSPGSTLEVIQNIRGSFSHVPTLHPVLWDSAELREQRETMKKCEDCHSNRISYQTSRSGPSRSVGSCFRQTLVKYQPAGTKDMETNTSWSFYFRLRELLQTVLLIITRVREASNVWALASMKMVINTVGGNFKGKQHVRSDEKSKMFHKSLVSSIVLFYTSSGKIKKLQLLFVLCSEN